MKRRNLGVLFGSRAARGKAKKVWSEYKARGLHSGRSGKIVSNPAQAKAIMFSEAAKAKARSKVRAR